MFLIAVSAKYKTKPSEHCGSGGIVSTTLILNSGVYLLFGCPFGIKMPPFVRLFNWYISIIPYCLTKGEHFIAAVISFNRFPLMWEQPSAGMLFLFLLYAFFSGLSRGRPAFFSVLLS